MLEGGLMPNKFYENPASALGGDDDKKFVDRQANNDKQLYYNALWFHGQKIIKVIIAKQGICSKFIFKTTVNLIFKL